MQRLHLCRGLLPQTRIPLWVGIRRCPASDRMPSRTGVHDDAQDLAGAPAATSHTRFAALLRHNNAPERADLPGG